MFFLFISFSAFSVSVEKVIYTGTAYTFRNTVWDNYLVLTSSLERKVVIVDLESREIYKVKSNVGIYPVISYIYKEFLMVIDGVGKQLLLYNVKNMSLIKNYELKAKPIFSERVGNYVYILDIKGNIFGFDFNLNIIYSYNFIDSPTYFYFYKGKPIGLILWDKTKDFELDRKFFNYDLITPSIVVNSYLVDTRGGKILNLEGGKINKISSYLSFATMWDSYLVVGSLYTRKIYFLKSDKIYKEIELKYQPTLGLVSEKYLVALSASDNKLMLYDGQKVLYYDTGKYPISVFKISNGIVVVCADFGEVWFYKF
ncbi:hypothetical protein JYK00_04400 [Thermosipho ferrireducens]|uniref:Uncharacterized protein n=1 Tax=Thermosipho ferrireducens TaxID=2571116 RepID=A0ABX7S839_9BACT|nr:hypothetical protein [Thermosipho ferrireducens]QTA38754.1 hypothetical protein JYK00_04400 [Thermosipho ferrireducens]